MKLKYSALCVVLLLAAAPAFSQTCPFAPVRLDPQKYQGLTYKGQTSGCEERNGIKCQSGEAITFTLHPAPGTFFQTCDRFKWNIDWIHGPITRIETIGPEMTYHFPVAWTRATGGGYIYKISGDAVNALGGDGRFVEVQLAPQSCAADLPSGALAVTFSGESSACSETGGRCTVGEKVRFEATSATYQIGPCDELVYDFGDGSLPAVTRERNREHIYFFPGPHTAKVTVRPSWNITLPVHGTSSANSIAATAAPGTIEATVTVPVSDPNAPARRRTVRR